MDLDALALAVDDLVRVPGSERGSGRLYGVRVDEDGNGSSIRLQLLAEGEARTLPLGLRPPAGVQAIALASGVWVAPMAERGPSLRPSLHPERRRAHATLLVGGADADDVSVIRYGHEEPIVVRDGLGLLHERMVRCWRRRQRGRVESSEAV